MIFAFVEVRLYLLYADAVSAVRMKTSLPDSPSFLFLFPLPFLFAFVLPFPSFHFIIQDEYDGIVLKPKTKLMVIYEF